MRATVSHHLPGRLRVVVEDMRNQELLAYRLQCALSQTTGIQSVQCNSDTGRALILFDDALISAQEVTAYIERFVETLMSAPPPEQTVAATIESDIAASPGNARHLAKPARNNPYFLPTVASSSLLAGLSLKRMFFGRSALAVSPLTFLAAAGVSIVAGYPALRRGVENLIKTRKVTPDLWLGIATVSMAAVRENLVALSVMTALNVAMYRRYSVISTPEDTHLDPEIERHSESMSRLSMVLAPAALAFTRSPLRAVGVALAANPRPAILSHKYRFAQAEQEAVERGLLVHSQASLASLAFAKDIVFSDESVFCGADNEWMVHPLQEKVDVGRVIGIAASLLQKSDAHPWKDAIIKRAKQDKRTLHTPFDVESSQRGVRGIVQGNQTVLGEPSFVAKCGVDDSQFQLEERRMRRQGFATQILAVEGRPLAIIGCKRAVDSAWETTLKAWTEQGYRLRTLRTDRLQTSRLEPITPGQLENNLTKGVTTIFVGRQPFAHHSRLVHISDLDAARLPQVLAFCNAKRSVTARDLRIVKVWNWIGTAVALASPATAPVIGLAGDVVSMFLIAAQHWVQTIGHKWSEITSRMRRQDTPTKGQGPRDGPSHGPASVQPAGDPEGPNFYSITVSELLKQLGVTQDGLSEAQVKERRGVWGRNLLVPSSTPHALRIFLAQFKELSTLILLGTSAVSFVMGERFSALCMAGILVVNALIGTWQEKRSQQVIQALKVENESQARVVRDGREQLIPTKDVVPGDVVVLEPGDKVPADVRILDASNLEANEAMLTGESVAVPKFAGELSPDTPLAERSNSLFMGTMITRGRCRGVVVGTGSATEIGRLGYLITGQDLAPTFLQTRVASISKRFVIGAFIAAGVVAVAGLLRGMPLAQLLISSVTLAASAIPEGLPLTITVALTAGVLQMSKRKAVIKKLANLESLGRVTVICSDKTGTLTKNEMTVKEIVTASETVEVSGEGYQPSGEFHSKVQPDKPLSVTDHAELHQLLTIGMLCNNAQRKEADAVPTGDATEAALLTVGQKANLNLDSWKRHREIPFDSTTRSMSVICTREEQANVVCRDDSPLRNCTLFAKGAPEAIVGKCTHYLLGGEAVEMTPDMVSSIREQNVRMANRALRVIALAYKELAEDENPVDAVDDNLVYVGLMGMMDPPKDGVSESIAEARRLGIKPVMITGDHAFTARAIATQVGIFRSGDSVLTGKELDQLSQDDLDDKIRTTSVFARVSPEHKLRIVEAYQRIGEVVAMTGDGVNDAPAIRKSDVGIAMGRNGTDITKGTAGIVLMEDHFHSIVEGVKGGRAIIGNIRKAMGCLLSGNLAEVLVTAISVAIGLPMPLIPLQILMMNILTDAVPAMVLATGTPKEVQRTPYKDVVDKTLYRTVLTRGAVLGVGAVGVFATAIASGMALPLAQTMAYASLVVGQLLQNASWRRYGSNVKDDFTRDRIFVAATAASWVALAATIYVPGLRTVFGTVPLGIGQWATVLAVTCGLTWFAKLCIERFVNSKSVRPEPAALATPIPALSM